MNRSEARLHKLGEVAIPKTAVARDYLNTEDLDITVYQGNRGNSLQAWVQVVDADTGKTVTKKFNHIRKAREFASEVQATNKMPEAKTRSDLKFHKESLVDWAIKVGTKTVGWITKEGRAWVLRYTGTEGLIGKDWTTEDTFFNFADAKEQARQYREAELS